MKHSEFIAKVKANRGIDIPEILRKQNEYFEKSGVGHMPPLKLIPEFTDRIFKDSIDHNMLEKKTKNMCGSYENDPDTLADGFIDMMHSSLVSFDNYERKGNWYVFFDEINEIFWKTKQTPEDEAMGYWVDFVLGD